MQLRLSRIVLTELVYRDVMKLCHVLDYHTQFKKCGICQVEDLKQILRHEEKFRSRDMFNIREG